MATTMPEPRTGLLTGQATLTREVGDIELGIAPDRLPPPPAARQPKACSSLVSWLVAKRLGSLLGDFTSANLELSIRSGRLLLQDVSLSPGALTEALALPLAVVEAHVARLEVLLPWRQTPPAPLMHSTLHAARGGHS